MVMDSLRYWVEVCHVDGFRFDLATTLARVPDGFDRSSGFVTAVRAAPVLASIKSIAGPRALGLPLILAGDEVGNTQSGNNNAYCQDNEIGWVDWEGYGRHGDDLTDFVGHTIGLRRRFPQIRSGRWLDGRRADGSYGVLWLT